MHRLHWLRWHSRLDPELPSRGFDEVMPSRVLMTPNLVLALVVQSHCVSGAACKQCRPANNNAIDMIFFILLSIQLT
jgi:hypothetical protein